MRGLALALTLGLAAVAGAASAEVTAKTPAGFQSKIVSEIAASPDKVWAALVQPSLWWNSSHTYSGKAANLSLEVKPGGCYCETLEGGGVRHMTVVYAQPARQLRLAGGLGPLQAEAVSGAWTFELKPSPTGTTLTQTMNVGGWMPTGLDVMAGPVDGVLAEQLGRLKRLVETGTP